MIEPVRADLSDDVDLRSPNVARMYDYLLGGSANAAADRSTADAIVEACPWTVAWARANRAFLGRVVRVLCERGVDQFLDLGSGVPTVGNVHEIAQKHNPSARVAYVDHEPVAVAHARELLGAAPRVSVTQADIRDPRSVLTATGVASLLDFDRPVAILAMATLDIVDSTDVAGLVASYRDACCPGSALGLSHGVITTLTDGEVDEFARLMGLSTTGALFRPRREVEGFLDGYAILEPGLVPLDAWRPETPVDEQEALRTNCYGGLGILP